jgi:hypothetical protein
MAILGTAAIARRREVLTIFCATFRIGAIPEIGRNVDSPGV